MSAFADRLREAWAGADLERFLELHHVYTVRDGRIVRMEDYPDRRSACEAVGLT